MTYLAIINMMFLPQISNMVFGNKNRRQYEQIFQQTEPFERNSGLIGGDHLSRPQRRKFRRGWLDSEWGSQSWQLWPFRNEPAKTRSCRAIKASVWRAAKSGPQGPLFFLFIIFLLFFYISHFHSFQPA